MLQKYTVTLSSREKLASNVYGLTFVMEQEQPLDFRAGQYMVFLIPQQYDIARRLFSIVSAQDQKNSFEIVMDYFPRGVASEYLTSLPLISTIDVLGPAGRFGLFENPRNKIFLATGTGIGPILSIVQSHIEKHKSKSFNLIWGIRSRHGVYFEDRLKTLAKKYSNFHYMLCLSQERDTSEIDPDSRAHAIAGRVQQGLDIFETFEHVKKLEDHDFYVCGSIKAVEDIRAHLYMKGIPPEQVHFERFT